MALAKKLMMVAPVGGGWDISKATYNAVIPRFPIVTQELSPQGLFFKPDGTKMYVVGSSGDDVNEYDLSTAWDVSTASYLQNFSVAAQETVPYALSFKPDGTKMYILGIIGDDVNEYNLSTAWDVSTASYLQNFSVAAQETTPQGIFFKPDGAKMYIIGSSGDDINEYNLSTAWDVSTASYVQNRSVATQDSSPTDLFFKPDGTKMYVLGSSGDDVNEYNLGTAWDISTAVFLGQFASFSVAAQEGVPTGLFFKPDGTKMYIVGSSADAVQEYNLSTAWDVSTAVWPAPTTRYFSVAAQETVPTDVFFKPDGTKMYVVGSSGDAVYEYNLGTAWDVSTASYLQTFSVSAQELSPQGLFFKPDGTKMYVVGSSGIDVNEYNLGTAWNISTASYLQTFSVSAQESGPAGVFFKPDGTKMYITGFGGDEVNEYNLSTAWNISTASYLQNFSVAAQETVPDGLFFKPDGTKMYIIGSSGDDVNEYDLSTAWDVSTASYLQNFSVYQQETGPRGLFFKPDGIKMYIVGTGGDAVLEYDL